MLTSPSILTRTTPGKLIIAYIFVSNNVVSSTITQETSVLQREEIRYQKIKKAALAIIITTRKMKLHLVIFIIDLAIKQILRKPDLVGRMTRWVVELSEFDIAFERRGHVKAQVLTDFINELTSSSHKRKAQRSSKEWIGVGVILGGPGGVLVKQSLHFGFWASNNQAEYEALLARI
ncbi:hypothetical protein CR513_32546, partial [Mucuna pruriens]